MKVKIIKYCHAIVDGQLLVLDAEKIIDIADSDATNLINNNLALQVENEINKTSCFKQGQDVSVENKMIYLISRRRGRPRKEV